MIPNSMNAKELESHIIKEAEKYIPFSLIDSAMDYTSIAEVGDQTAILLVATEHKFVKNLERIARLAKANLIAVDVKRLAAEAIIRTYYNVIEPKHYILGLDLDKKYTKISKVYTLGFPTYFQKINVKESTGSDNPSPEEIFENTINIIKLSLKEKADGTCDKILLFGPLVANKLEEKLQALLDIKIELFNPANMMSSSQTVNSQLIQQTGHHYVNAFGLALRNDSHE